MHSKTRQKRIIIIVSDSGIGIPKEQQNKIFERFRQANNTIQVNNEGTGLGLSISKGFAEALGGTITVESEEGKGSFFSFSIPYSKTKNEKKEVPDIDAKAKRMIPDFKNKTVLIVEDEINNFRYINEILKQTGAKIIWSRNGLNAIQQILEAPAIDLVLMDVKLPLMDGYTAAKKIKALNENIPIIIQTAFGMESDKKRSMDEGLDGYIAKPILERELLNILEQFLSIRNQ